MNIHKNSAIKWLYINIGPQAAETIGTVRLSPPYWRQRGIVRNLYRST